MGKYKKYNRENEGEKTFSVVCSKLWNMLPLALHIKKEHSFINEQYSSEHFSKL
jgi:hypothetical protein